MKIFLKGMGLAVLVFGVLYSFYLMLWGKPIARSPVLPRQPEAYQEVLVEDDSSKKVENSELNTSLNTEQMNLWGHQEIQDLFGDRYQTIFTLFDEMSQKMASFEKSGKTRQIMNAQDLQDRLKEVQRMNQEIKVDLENLKQDPLLGSDALDVLHLLLRASELHDFVFRKYQNILDAQAVEHEEIIGVENEIRELNTRYSNL